jgi:hypothetical protein
MRFGGGFDLFVDPENPSSRFKLDLASHPQNLVAFNNNSLNVFNARSTASLMRELDGTGNGVLGFTSDTINQVVYGCVDYKTEKHLLNASIGFTQGGLGKLSGFSLTPPADIDLFSGFYGWGGAGGSLCMVDPHITIAFCIITGGSGFPVTRCPRVKEILTAFHSCKTI